jgi:hypothetical protein
MGFLVYSIGCTPRQIFKFLCLLNFHRMLLWESSRASEGAMQFIHQIKSFRKEFVYTKLNNFIGLLYPLPPLVDN